MTPRKDLLDIESLTDEEIHHLLEAARPFKALFSKSVKKVNDLAGRTVLTLFYEPSTRTRSSFEVAANRLSADVTHFQVATSSVVKGESVLDTVDTLQAMKTDYIIVRHQAAGIPNLIARHTSASVLNAGDGAHAHPTQALLDGFTVGETLSGDLNGRRVVIVGDWLHSRVARSTAQLLGRMGLQVGVLGPATLIPRGLPDHLHRLASWDDLLRWQPEVIYLLRVQMERQQDQFFPSVGEYHRIYGLTESRLKQVRDAGIWVMHPGPVNRGVELADAVMTYERSLIDQQVENGIAVRMAVLAWLKPGTPFRGRLPH